MKESLLNELNNMTEEQVYASMFEDFVSGALNRRAYELDNREFMAIIDLDSLKYINDNLGHRAGDKQLRRLAQALITVFGKDSVYRLSGDEFAVKYDDPNKLFIQLIALRAGLPTFSFGIGLGLDQADRLLLIDKGLREKEGSRAQRGEKPCWFEDVK